MTEFPAVPLTAHSTAVLDGQHGEAKQRPEDSLGILALRSQPHKVQPDAGNSLADEVLPICVATAPKNSARIAFDVRKQLDEFSLQALSGFSNSLWHWGISQKRPPLRRG